MYCNEIQNLLRLLQEPDIQNAIIAIMKQHEAHEQSEVHTPPIQVKQGTQAERPLAASEAAAGTVLPQQSLSAREDRAKSPIPTPSPADEGHEKKKWHQAYDELADKFKSLTGQCKQATADKVHLQENYEALQNGYHQLVKDSTLLQQNYDTLQQTHESLQSQYAAVEANLKRVIDVAQQYKKEAEQTAAELQQARQQFRAQQVHITQLEQQVQADRRQLGQYQQVAARMTEQLQNQEKACQALQRQLAQRFDEGWHLYESYGRISAHTQQLLGSVFTGKDFMSFICGGAQDEALGKIWDVLRHCLLNDFTGDVQILWPLFQYCLKLVNASKTQTIYALLPVAIGDRFDVDVHSPTPDSRAQGQVQAIYLQGYANIYSHKTERKSMVTIG